MLDLTCNDAYFNKYNPSPFVLTSQITSKVYPIIFNAEDAGFPQRTAELKQKTISANWYTP